MFLMKSTHVDKQCNQAYFSHNGAPSTFAWRWLVSTLEKIRSNVASHVCCSQVQLWQIWIILCPIHDMARTGDSREVLSRRAIFSPHWWRLQWISEWYVYWNKLDEERTWPNWYYRKYWKPSNNGNLGVQYECDHDSNWWPEKNVWRWWKYWTDA